jgi:hypothetical protein
LPAPADQVVVAGAADQVVVAGAADQVVVAGAADQDVVAVPAVGRQRDCPGFEAAAGSVAEANSASRLQLMPQVRMNHRGASTSNSGSAASAKRPQQNDSPAVNASSKPPNPSGSGGRMREPSGQEFLRPGHRG